ncbi:MAG: ATPase, T2SS/T4P/T4SS family [Pirellulaceae bacterium]
MAAGPFQDGQPLYIGGYLAGYKLAIIAVIYLIWVVLAAAVNRSLLRSAVHTGMSGALWNLINVGSCLLGLVAALFVPIFWIGMPIFLIAVMVPPLLYRTVYKGIIRNSDVVAAKVNPEQFQASANELPQNEGAEMDFYPAGNSEEAQRRAGIMARQSPEFATMKNLLANLLEKRADLLMMDFTRNDVAVRMQVDGAWHVLPGLDRVRGDQLLESLKFLSGLNAVERKARQQGTFKLNYPSMKTKPSIELTSQGVPTGERVQLKILRASGADMNLKEIGLNPELEGQVRKILNDPGLVLVTAPPQGGLTTTWRAFMLGLDRFTKDCMAIVPDDDRETEVENVIAKHFALNEDSWPIIRNSLLTQPSVVVVPVIQNGQILDRLAEEVIDEDRTIVTRDHAGSAVEGLIRLVSRSKDRAKTVSAVRLVTCQRLVRELCDECRVPFPVKPDFIAKIGGNPQITQVVYRPFVPPPPDQQVDEKGNPIEIEICPKCQGLGYTRRTVVLETLVVNEALQKALLQSNDPNLILAIAKKSGHLDLLQRAYQLVLEGKTSVEEVKRIFTPPKPVAAR